MGNPLLAVPLVIDSRIHVPIDLELGVLTSSTCQGQYYKFWKISEEAKFI